MCIDRAFFGNTRAGQPVELYTLTNRGGASVEVITYGGAVRSIRVPDRQGRMADVALGYDQLEPYELFGGNLGALVGRVANRIEGGRFTLGGREYRLYCNDGANHLHGGKEGFHRKVWRAERRDGRLELFYRSADGEEGYPGNLDVTVAYSLSDDGSLTIDYTAVSDQDTVVNLTNHTYFNLAGQGNGTVLGHRLLLNCDDFTENNAACLPTGVISCAAGTPFDFTSYHTIGERIGQNDPQLNDCGGYDHNFIINPGDSALTLAAELWEKESGRLLRTYTTMPGIQLYTGNFLDESFIGKGGVQYHKHSGVCLETQYFPNALRHSHFPSPVLRAGQVYRHTTVYQFSVK